MTKEKKLKLEELEARQNAACIDFKLQMVPASIKNTYSSISGKDELVSRELIVNNNQVFIGIEYANGEPVSAYTTDPTGKRISLEKLDNVNESVATRDLISNRLSELSKQLVAQTNKEEKTEQKAPQKKKTIKIAPASKVFAQREAKRA